MNNNIFTYATSELTQDAFLFYLLNFANTDTTEGKLARNFLKLFTQNRFINEENYKNFKIYSYKQFLKIDVLLIFVNENNQKDSFILLIEDKIYANESRYNQLAFYVNEFQKRNIPKIDINNKRINYNNLKDIFLSNIVPVYFKTGTLDSYELLNNNTFDFEIIFKCLENVSTNNIIIEQWKEKIVEKKNFKDKIKKYIEENAKLDNFVKLVYEYGYDGLEIINTIGEFIFGKIKTGEKSKFCKEDSYNFETWKENAMGHPEFNLNIKPAFLFKECNSQKYNAENQKLVLVPIIRLRNFEVCVILEIVILDTKQNKRITYANKKFFKDNPNIDAIFKNERKEFYDNLVNEFNIIKNIEIFKDIEIDKIKKGNLMLTKFGWDEILELHIKDFKKFILKLQESLENVAIKLNYEKQW